MQLCVLYRSNVSSENLNHDSINIQYQSVYKAAKLYICSLWTKLNLFCKQGYFQPCRIILNSFKLFWHVAPLCAAKSALSE